MTVKSAKNTSARISTNFYHCRSNLDEEGERGEAAARWNNLNIGGLTRHTQILFLIYILQLPKVYFILHNRDSVYLLCIKPHKVSEK